MPLPLVAPGELAPAEIAGERLLPRVRADVSGEVVAAAEVPHANPALERFMSGVDANVSGELVGAGEAPIATLRRTRVWALVDRRLAGSVRILSGSQDGPQWEILGGVCGGKPRRGSPLDDWTTQRVISDRVQRGQRWRDAECI